MVCIIQIYQISTHRTLSPYPSLNPAYPFPFPLPLPFPKSIASPSSPPPGAGACTADPAEPPLTGVVAAPTLSTDPFGFGTADRGRAVNVAVDGVDTCPLPPPPEVLPPRPPLVGRRPALDGAPGVELASLPMNHPGTQPLSPVSILMLIISMYFCGQEKTRWQDSDRLHCHCVPI